MISHALAQNRTEPQIGREPAADDWRRSLADIPSHFGKLAFLASLRDAETGRYSHPSLASLDSEEADRTLRSNHQHVFQRWLAFGLAEQKADLENYLISAGGPRHAILYRHLPPGNARDVERQLYLTDLETLLELLRFADNASFSIPET